MTWLAYRNLFQNKIRLFISIGGVALALLLIFALDAIFTGVERQITAYIDNSGADLIVSQPGVRNLHMASSSLPVKLIEDIREYPGIQYVTPILYLTNLVVIGEERNLAYIIGLDPESEIGGPWKLAAGRRLLNMGEAIIDWNIARKSGVELGEKVEILGHPFEVVGLSKGTANLVNSVAFISLQDFSKLRNSSGVISFLLIQIQPDISTSILAEQLEGQIGNITVQSRAEMSSQERQVVKDMSTDVITIMNLVGFLIGLAVMGLTVYTSTLSRRKEYGVLKALGARNGQLYWTVLSQAILSVLLGFGAGLAFTFFLASLIPLLGQDLVMKVSGISVLKVAGISLVIASISALLPIRQIANLDPAIVFRGK